MYFVEARCHGVLTLGEAFGLGMKLGADFSVRENARRTGAPSRCRTIQMPRPSRRARALCAPEGPNGADRFRHAPVVPTVSS